ncbi:MAG: universal stress protein [Actinomycetota bacterium]|nr:universal stress protein [Actinomycetota bacterium]
MDRILLAVDGSEHSIRAATLAGELSFRFGAPVDVINVVPDGTPIVPGAVHEYAQLQRVSLTQRDLLESLGGEIVAVASHKVKEAGGDVGKLEVRLGTPPYSIVAFAEDAGSDCIVMGRRGMGDLKGLLMGSVSHRVGHLTDKTLITTE